MSVPRQNVIGCMAFAAVLMTGVTAAYAQKFVNQSTASVGVFAPRGAPGFPVTISPKGLDRLNGDLTGTNSLPASATTPSASSGTFANALTPPSGSRSADGNLFLTYTRSGVNTGTYTGPYLQELEVVIHPDGHTNFRGTTTCVCTVEQQTGTLVIRFQGMGMAGAQFSGSYVVVSGTDGLENLRGHGTFEGAGLTGTYAGHHHFDP